MRSLLFIFIIYAACLSAQEIDLSNAHWLFSKHQQKQTVWRPAKVPGNVYLDLYTNLLIQDPFKDCNEKDLQWINETDWDYKCMFIVTEEMMAKKNINLIFEGLDTYAKVSVNGECIFDADNMFVEWKINAKKLLKPGKNELLIEFESPLKRAKANWDKNKLPGGPRVYVRKAQYQFGWDWGPTYPGVAIWKGIKLRAYDEQIDNGSFVIKKISDTEALMNLDLQTNFMPEKKYNLKITDKGNKKILLDTLLFIDSNSLIPFKIKQPKRWWCNNLGEPYLYELEAKIQSSEGDTFFLERSVGLRTIELQGKKEKNGESFAFILNGVPVYAKGANWIPSSYFLNDTVKMLNDLSAAKNANMNMLRVWGGGVYESDAFYEWCDRNGMLVWQDFMFACGMYPGDETFFESVNKEVQQQTLRIGQHSCIALWCGNNENIEGWYNWGWQKEFGYSQTDSLKIINDYNKLFNNELPDMVKKYSSGIPYWPSSPSIGWGREEAYKQGDVHYWGVWWGMQKFETYRDKVGRFNSEYGFQALPDISSIQKYSTEVIRDTSNAFLKCHEKHPKGFQTIDSALVWYYPKAKNLDQYVYLSQLAQAKALKIAIEAHRTAKPYNMGTLLWQLNDCWPSISWSVIDFDSRPKAAWYEVKRTFKNRNMFFRSSGKGVSLFAVNDSISKWKDSVVVYLMNVEGKVVKSWSERFVYDALAHASVVDIIDSELPEFDKKKTFLFAKSGNLQCTYYFVDEKDLELEVPFCKMIQVNDSTVSVSADRLMKAAYIYNPEAKGLKLVDNYIDIVPGNEYLIHFRSDTATDPKHWRVKSIVDIR